MPSMKRLLQYLLSRSPLICLYAVCVAVFFAVQLLSGQPMTLVLYTLLLLTAALAAFLLWDYLRLRQRLGRLSDILSRLEDFEQEIPPGQGLVEEAYADIARGLFARAHNSRQALEREYQNMIEYYTMWVHQVKTPLFALRLLLEAGETPSREAVGRELFEIERYADMALTYAKAGALSGDLILKPLEVDKAVRDAVKKYAGLFIGKRLTLTITPTGFRVPTDEKWLSFIVEQALSNAIKYTRSGGVRIYGEGDGTLVIADTGIGIRPEDVARVFEKGYTGYNGRVDKRASGIGLYLAKKIAGRMGIALSITSVVGEGTAFRLTFPPAESLWTYE